jgi:glycosyltransferase involved in cell wall biosynthesis
MGPAHARLAGQKEASSDIIVFIDSDIVIASNTLSRLADTFDANGDAAAIVGMLSKNHPNRNFFSQYKNLYMNFIFRRCPPVIDFVFGSFYAIRKERCDTVSTNRVTAGYKVAEDTEYGLRLARQGFKIILDKNLEVTHLRGYSFFSFIRNDFFVPYYWARLFLKEKGWTSLLKERRFCHSQTEQLASLVLMPPVLITIFWQPLAAVLLILIQLSLHMPFFLFLYREKGASFMLSSLIVTWLDWLVMSSGIISGLVTGALSFYSRSN